MATRRSGTSAGIVLFRRPGGRLEVLIGHMGGPVWSRRDERAWTIPKGEYGPDEDPWVVAGREFREETGHVLPDASTAHDLGEIRQSGGKRVRAWAVAGDIDAASAVSNTFEMEWPPRSGETATFPEVDRWAWMDVETAGTKVVAAQAELLDRLAQYVAGAVLDAPRTSPSAVLDAPRTPPGAGPGC